MGTVGSTAVQVVEVDRLYPQALQRLVAARLGVLGPPVDQHPPFLAPGDAELGGDDHVSPMLGQDAANEPLVVPEPVGVGGIEQGDPELDGPSQRRHRFVFVGRPVGLGHAHAAEAEGGYRQPLGSQLAVTHRSGRRGGHRLSSFRREFLEPPDPATPGRWGPPRAPYGGTVRWGPPRAPYGGTVRWGPPVHRMVEQFGGARPVHRMVEQFGGARPVHRLVEKDARRPRFHQTMHARPTQINAALLVGTGACRVTAAIGARVYTPPNPDAEDAKGCAQRPLLQDREARLPRFFDLGPVVVLGHDCALTGRFEPVAVEVPEPGRADATESGSLRWREWPGGWKPPGQH